MITRKMTCLALLAAATVGCSAEPDGQSFTQLTPVDAQHFAVHRHTGPDAIVSAAGELAIAGKAVSLNSDQKRLAAEYFAHASAVRDDGFATGLAGASTAMTALSSVASNLAAGTPDKIGPAVEAKASKIQAHVDKLCRDLHELTTVQDALAASLPEFKPYAMIGGEDVENCLRR